MLRRADGSDGIPVLAPRLCFAGLEESEVGLVVGIDASHQFDVRGEFAIGIGVGQVPIPGVAEFVVAPSPLFFARRDVMVGDVDEAGLRLVIIAAEEISA